MDINTSMNSPYSYTGNAKTVNPLSESGESRNASQLDGNRDDLKVSQTQSSGPTLNERGQLVGQKIDIIA